MKIPQTSLAAEPDLPGVTADLHDTEKQNRTFYSLERCIDLVLQNSYTVRLAEKGVERSRLARLTAVSAFLPVASSRMSGSRWISKGELYYMGYTIGEFEESDDSYSTGLTLSLPVYTGGLSSATYRAASVNEEVSMFSLEESKRAAVLEVKLDYYNVILNKILLSLQEENLGVGLLKLEKVRERHNLGFVPLTDVLRMQVEVAGYREALVDAGKVLKLAEYELLYILNLPLDTGIGFDDAFPDVDYSLAEVTPKVPDGRGDLEISRLAVDIAKSDVKIAASAFKPVLSIYYSYTWRDRELERIRKILDTNYYWDVGLTIEVPLFKGLSTWHTFSEKKVALEETELSYKEKRREAEKEMLAARLEFSTAIEKYELSSDRVRQAEEEVRLAEESYAGGLAILLETIQARADLEAAKAARTRALFTLKSAEATTDYYLGRLR